MKIDSHQHFWNYDAVQYPWMRPEWPIRRDFLPRDLAPLLREAGLDGSIAVQARQSLEESQWLIALAADEPSIAGVVGWVDLRSASVARDLERLACSPKFVGVRHVVQDEPDDRFMLGKEFLRGISELRRFGLAYDFLVFPHQLPAAVEVAGMFPRQPFVLDHIAKPRIADRVLEPWANHIRELARCPNVWCKVSGMVTEARWKAWKPSDFEPYLDVVFEAFGPERLMYGSDWPVCLLAGDYANVAGLAKEAVRKRFPGSEEAIFGGNAARFYRIGDR